MKEVNEEIVIEKFILDIRSKFPEVSAKLDEWMEIQGLESEDKMCTAIMEHFSKITTDSFR